MKFKNILLRDIAVEDKSIIAPNSVEVKKRPYLGLEQIESQSGKIICYENLSIDGKSNTYAFDQSHVLYGKLRPYLNKVAVPEQKGRCSTEIIPILPKSVDREFLAFLLRSDQVVSAAMQEKTGSRMPRANMSEFFGLELRIPALEEDQRRIAARLKSQLAEVDKARKAVMIQHADVRLLESRILCDIFDSFKFTSHVKIGDGADTTSGSTPSRGDKTFWAPAEIPWVKTGEVAFNAITEAEESISKKALKQCSLKLLPPKTVLVAMYGQGKTRGQSAILDVEATINQACFAILPNDTWLPEFLFFWLKRSYLDLRVLSEDRGGNQSNLNGALLKNFLVPAPSLNIQRQLIQKVRDALQEVNALGDAIRKTVAEINLLPQKILSEAFGGGDD